MKKLLALLLAILTMVSVVGCGQAASNPADDDPAAIRDNINLVLDQAVEGLNPWKSTSIVDRQLAYQLYEPLYYRNTEGVYEPKLAESYTLSEDGRTYTFKIRQGVKFHNGQELTAEDVAWSIEYGFVSGPYAGARGKLSNVESAYVVDEETVNIVCKDTDSSFFGNLMIYGLILCKDEFLKAEEAGTVGVEFVPMGTGPYTITSYSPDTEIHLQAFPDYWGGKARIDKAKYSILSDNNSVMVAFESGDLDMIMVPTTYWASISANDAYTTYPTPGSHTAFFQLNNTLDASHPLSNKLVRQAISYAFDREAVVLAAIDGVGEPAYSIFNPEVVFGGMTVEEMDAAGINSYQYNPEKAKELLAEAGYPDGVDIGTIMTISGYYWEKIATVLQSNLADIGVTVKIELMDSATCRANRASHNYELATTGDYFAPEASTSYFYYRLLSEEQIAAGEYTDTGVHNEELEAAYKAVFAAVDENERKDAYVELNRILQDQVYTIPAFNRTYGYAFNKNLTTDELSADYHYIYDFAWK